jgi:hypothetical protein
VVNRTLEVVRAVLRRGALRLGLFTAAARAPATSYAGPLARMPEKAMCLLLRG